MARILVAEDFAPVRFFIAETLAQIGHEPIPVADGIAGFHLLKRERFDMVVTDDYMGGGKRNGNKMLVRARRAKCVCPRLVMISGGYAKYLWPGKEWCLELLKKKWGVEFLAIIPGRPFTDETLVKEVDMLLSLSS